MASSTKKPTFIIDLSGQNSNPVPLLFLSLIISVVTVYHMVLSSLIVVVVVVADDS